MNKPSSIRGGRGSSNTPGDGSMNSVRDVGRRAQQGFYKAFRLWTGGLTSASDTLLSRVEGHLVMSVRLHHVIGGTGNSAMMWCIQPRFGR